MATAPRLSRRQALGLAVTGAAGAAGLRVLTLHLGGAAGVAGAAGNGAGSWASPLGDSRALAAHLLRRGGFTATPEELDVAARMSYSDLVDSLLAQKADPMPLPAQSTNYAAVVQAWYAHMATTQAQFPERMTLFWHGVLTSDYRKANRLPVVYIQNRTQREKGTGDLRSLLLAMTYDPLMGRYLDLDQSTGKHPNENYARELMELYTLGVGHYSEQDVREAARALSGIRTRLLDASGNPATPPKIDRTSQATVAASYAKYDTLMKQGYTFQGYLAPRMHDMGSKTFLGRTGNLGPDEVIDTILSNDACAPFIATRALQYFAAPQPSAGYVTRVATALRSSRYDIRTMMRAVFTDDEFTAAANYRSLVRSPADYMVAVMRILGQPDISRVAVPAGQGMDQVLYDPPTVAGWAVNAGWISSSSMLARVNFAQAVVNRGGALPDPVAAVRTHLDNVVGPDTARVFNASTTSGDRWYALLASPEFQLK